MSPPPANSGRGAAQPTTVADIFPPGPGRDLVLETCGGCHAVACSARGQRTADRWDNIKAGHKDHVASLASADFDLLFSYLKEHFNETIPEPLIPAEFLQEGCTPF